MLDIHFRCSSLGRLMTEPKTKAEGILSVGAKTYVRELAQQMIFNIEFQFSSKETRKGNDCEADSIALLNQVRGLSLVKNTERKTNEWITGECDLFDDSRRCGHDLKTSWSAATFPCWPIDGEDKGYDWQMRGYMWLWDADEWEINYALVDTPEELIGYEALSLHVVSHIPAHHRLTTIALKRDKSLEERMAERCAAAREYWHEVVRNFDALHPEPKKESKQWQV